MATQTQKIRIAFRNGKKQGYDLGFEHGFNLAYDNLTAEIASMLKGRKDVMTALKPIRRFCTECFKGLQSNQPRPAADKGI
jgi:hypothetical protein